MAGSSHTSSPSTGPLLLPDPPHSAPEPASCARLPAECQLVEVRGVRVASFTVSGARLICLPQVFQLFLKHLVGGLHTVYTKLKRLHILPVVCTVEQVRVLRGLGAIQPGVNRCKLITTEDFETLYRDCTNASSRPGRPPKRTLVGVANMTDSSRLLPHRLLSPALLSQTGLTAAAMAEVMKLQKVRMMIGFHGDGDQHRQHNGAESGNEETGSNEVSSLHINTLQQHSAAALLANRLSELPFMVAPHHLLPVGLPPASITMAMNQMSQLSSLANMAAMTQEEESPAGSPSPSDDEIPTQEPTSQSPSRASSSSSSPSSSPPPAHTLDLDDSSMPLPLLKPANEKLPLSTPPAHRAFTPFLLAEGLSSMETLLTNIQGLLKVAVESARSQDQSNQQERKELKLELERERDARHTLQKQLSSELHTRVSIQRRLKKEKKAKRKLQEALDFESRRREHVERSIKHLETDSATPESELENRQQENCSENRKFSKPPILF